MQHIVVVMVQNILHDSKNSIYYCDASGANCAVISHISRPIEHQNDICQCRRALCSTFLAKK